jgi:solute carrier family 45 protein 1/2/4
MMSFSASPLAEAEFESDLEAYDDKHWAGSSKILGPRWAHLPAINAGMLGVQIFWSVEMSYGEY